MKAATDIILSLVEIYALVKYGCLLIQIRLHMNLYTEAHHCSMNICGMISFGAFSASSYLVWSEDVNNLNGFIWVSELVFISNSFDSSLHDNEYEK